MRAILLALALLLAMTDLVQGQTGAQEGGANPASSEYRLGAEDVIRIQAWGRADLFTDAVLDDAGRISLPLVGRIDAAGRTPAELGRYLIGRYQLLDPKITEVLVTVVEYNSLSVTVVGEVRNPGRHAFREIPDLWKVLLTAGGTTPEADLARVQIVRREERTDETSRIVSVDLSKGIERIPVEALPALRPRDTVIVPSLTENVATGDRFQILGAVRAPGSYKVQSAGTVIEALSLAGGGQPDADLRKTRLTRPTANGAMSYTLNLDAYLQDGRPPANLRLKPGDTITIPSRVGGARGVLEGVVRLAPIVSLATSVVSLIVASR